MTHDSAGLSNVPAPCLVDQGIVVNKTDMLRLLSDLGQVNYTDMHEDGVLSSGTGYVMDVFAEPGVSTLVANQSLYLNVYSFDYIQLDKLPDNQTCFKLFQESRCLQLVPLTSPIKEQAKRDLDAAAIEEIVAEALSATWDACLDDDGPLA
ncbi:hypothetical protein [Leptolyngbya iicbica]|uniref:Uncharacterized protein n=2 Tax=Cyanophyceae TaxID=3028117 RepID=A0A4Q7E4Q5_9CYAN|nr:hypothetical protein [Leptolyngbya sp. LK]RZM76589.1 hypothetical protein DYY88_18165 [Leptolyngbya sp. LK]